MYEGGQAIGGFSGSIVINSPLTPQVPKYFEYHMKVSAYKERLFGHNCYQLQKVCFKILQVYYVLQGELLSSASAKKVDSGRFAIKNDLAKCPLTEVKDILQPD